MPQTHPLLSCRSGSLQLVWEARGLPQMPYVLDHVSVRACFNNAILSQFPLILGPKSSLFPCGMWLFFFFSFFFFLFLFCFIDDLSRDRGRKTNIFCSMDIIPVLCIWDIYIVSLEMGVQ